MSIDRILVMADIAEQFELVVKGVLTKMYTQSSPTVAFSASKARLNGIVSEAIFHGAHIIWNGASSEDKGKTNLSSKDDDNQFTPIVVSGIKPDMQVWQEETFGPLVSIRIVQTEQEAIDGANDTGYGLSMSELSLWEPTSILPSTATTKLAFFSHYETNSLPQIHWHWHLSEFVCYLSQDTADIFLRLQLIHSTITPSYLLLQFLLFTIIFDPSL